jgi:hypothetical protein
MSDQFFDLRSPRDMLDKAIRERERMKQDLSIDNVFYFFITAFHVFDYVKKSGLVSESDLTELLGNHDIYDCCFICFKAKHLKLEFNL